MTLTNASQINITDLQNLTGASLVLCSLDASQNPVGCEANFVFHNLTAALTSSNPERCKATFIAPYDMLIECLAVMSGDFTAASTTTITVSCLGIFDAFPLVISGTTGASTKLTRILYDNSTKIHGKPSNALNSKAVRVIPGGSTVDIIATTTSVATPSMLQVILVYSQFFARV